MVNPDYGLTPAGASPTTGPQLPWEPCHIVMWAPAKRRTAARAAGDDNDDDDGPPPPTSRPFYYGKLANLTFAPDMFTFDREDHNLLQYRVHLGTEKLITTALIASGELTLAGGKPTVIPRWFSLGYAREEAKEAAVIRQAQTLFHGLSRERDHIDHAQTHLWVVQPGHRTTRQPPFSQRRAASSSTTAPQPSPARPHPTAGPSQPRNARRLPVFHRLTADSTQPLDSTTTTPAAADPQPGQVRITCQPHTGRAPDPDPGPDPDPDPDPAAEAAASQPPPNGPGHNVSPADAARYRACWEQLCHAGIRRADIAVTWRALHCQLHTPSFLTYCRYKPPRQVRASDGSPLRQACCQWPACVNTIATTTHVLLDCPLARPAADWLCTLWAAIDDGNFPPATPDVIIAGDPAAWNPARRHLDLWTRLRILFLKHAWAAHRAVHQDGPSQSPTSIAAATFQSAARAMRTEFIAAYTAPTELAQQCDAHMTGSRQRQSRDDSGDTPAGAFGRIWTDSGLCSVRDGRLVVHWTTTHPTPLPHPSQPPPAAPNPAQPPPTAPAPPPVPPAQPPNHAPLPRLHLIPATPSQ